MTKPKFEIESGFEPEPIVGGGRPPRAKGNGAGYGGPAMGASLWGNGQGPSFQKIGVPSKRIERMAGETKQEYRLRKMQRALEMEDVIYNLAKDNGEHSGVRLNAAAKLHEIYEGRPIQRVITDEQPIERDVIDPRDLSPEAREALREAIAVAKDKSIGVANDEDDE